MAEPTPQQILATPMGDNDANATTIREYLIELLATLWREQSDFSGKRPFGNSSWPGELELALIKAGHVAGRLDEDGYIEAVDSDHADQLIRAAIESFRQPMQSEPGS